MSVGSTLDEVIAAAEQRRGGRTRDPFTAADLLDALTRDPANPMDRGRLRALRTRATGRDRELVDRVLALAEAAEPPAPAEPHPMVLRRRPDPRPLTAGDLALLDQLRNVAPAQVTAEDARIVAELEATAQTSADRRLVAQVAGPLRRHHDRRLEEAQLRATVADATRTVDWRSLESTALPLLAERLAAEARAEVVAELAGTDVQRETLERLQADAASLAEHQARDTLAGAWANAVDERNGRKSAAEVRLAALALGADPTPLVVPDYAAAHEAAGALEAGRDRARREHPALADA